MTTENKTDLVKIRRALISVSDKTGIVDFVRELKRFGVEIISTGGTAKALRDAGLAVRDVSDVTKFPEMMDGRIKTLHPRIHGGLLAVRGNPEHLAAMSEHDIEPIDMVVVNLYPFEETIKRDGVTLDEAVEQIDIGGPAMIRSAAKNFAAVTVVVLPKDYARVTEEMQKEAGSVSLATRNSLAREAFAQTSRYDMLVLAYLMGKFSRRGNEAQGIGGQAGGSAFSVGSHGIASRADAPRIDSEEFSIETFRGGLPGSAQWTISKTANLRYGENPHQIAALYKTASRGGIANAELLSGKEMSFNNYVDADAAWQLVFDFEETACAIIKHTNPAGVGLSAHAVEAYRKALATDPVSAFGGIVGFNCPVDEATAGAVIEIFTEVVVAPGYDEQALEVLRSKKNLRVLRVWPDSRGSTVEYKQISGGMLVQTRDTHRLKREDLKVVTKRAPSDKEIDDLLFAWTVCKHTKSNAIVYVRDRQTVGVGAG
ncbi:MAG TPA: bifunctional phosphoribosylaminoimidazolecarboxamide formyltransferase/IMP cyclohydrolase, partial [Pyrinomonadaceae bacterium]|nr:bifunctional phosphoribosylaminoimidazolecarboxamide formyltransferase/IMP cyclohydrolase [Pyrinomonadaceae bacterium]